MSRVTWTELRFLEVFPVGPVPRSGRKVRPEDDDDEEARVADEVARGGPTVDGTNTELLSRTGSRRRVVCEPLTCSLTHLATSYLPDGGL